MLVKIYTIMFLFISLIYSYKWDVVKSSDSLFHVKLMTEMGQRIDYKCQEVEEFSGRFVLHTKEGRINVYMGNINSIEIKKIPKSDKIMPDLTKNINFSSNAVGGAYRDEKSKLMGILYQISFKILTSKNNNELKYYANTLNSIVNNRPELNSFNEINTVERKSAREKRIYAKKIRTQKLAKEQKKDKKKISLKNQTRFVCVPKAFVRKHGNLKSEVIDDIKFGTKIKVRGYKDQWYKIVSVNGKTGWIHNRLVVASRDALEKFKREKQDY